VDAAPYLKLDGTTPMTGNTNLGNHYAINMLHPIISTDGANKGYVDSAIAVVTSLVSTVVNSLSSASVNISDFTSIRYPLILTQSTLVLDTNVNPNPSNSAKINCVNSSGGTTSTLVWFQIFQPGYYNISFTSELQNVTTSDITVDHYIRTSGGANLLTIPSATCPGKPNGGAPNTITLYLSLELYILLMYLLLQLCIYWNLWASKCNWC
jgi:hypothetical protein